MPKGSVLAVDDQRYFRELIEDLLTEDGYEVQTAASGEEALRVLGQQAFDVVITDLVMPVMSGSELVQRIKTQNPDQDIVVITGVVDVKSAVDAMKIGANDYLLKPFDREALSASLDAILRHRRLCNERDRLLEENIEYMSERSLFERAMSLFGSLRAETLAQRVLDGLGVETDAQGGPIRSLAMARIPSNARSKRSASGSVSCGVPLATAALLMTPMERSARLMHAMAGKPSA